MLKIGVPSKGRLQELTFQWFGAQGVTMRQTGNDREYSGAVDGIDGVELVLLSAGEIPRDSLQRAGFFWQVEGNSIHAEIPLAISAMRVRAA